MKNNNELEKLLSLKIPVRLLRIEQRLFGKFDSAFTRYLVQNAHDKKFAMQTDKHYYPF